MKIIHEEWTSALWTGTASSARIVTSHAPTVLKLVAMTATAGILLIFLAPKAPPVHDLNVAFIGNSITFVNDIPRLMEALSHGKIHQNSCLHGSLNFRSMIRKGNGMYQKWRRKNARLGVDEDGHKLYDYGACTVPQLLVGYDGNLTQNNENGYYTNDGKNPCLQDEYYYDYITGEMQERMQQESNRWDVVVMNDRTIYPALYQTRQSSIRILKSRYVYYLNTIKARPVLLMTYGYYTNDTTYGKQLGDIPEFTSHLYYGYRQYAGILAKRLPPSQQPLIAPVGLAFLTIWEENYVFWRDYLFFSDGLHPSPHGSFLLGCVLFATIYGRLPSLNLSDENGAHRIHALFSRARRMEVGQSTSMPLPTKDQALYLMNIADRVVLRGHIPRSLLSLDEVKAIEAQYVNVTLSLRRLLEHESEHERP